TTLATRTPWGLVDASTATPRNTPFTGRGARGRFGPPPGSRGKRPGNGRSLVALRLSPPRAVARPIANALPKMMATATNPTSAAITHFGNSHPARRPGAAPAGGHPRPGAAEAKAPRSLPSTLLLRPARSVARLLRVRVLARRWSWRRLSRVRL